MERGTKLAGGYLRLSCVFLAFLCVSSDVCHNPNPYMLMNDIINLLNKLKVQLSNVSAYYPMTSFHIKNKGIAKPCGGIFLNIFQSGTVEIFNGILNPTVKNITSNIDKCVTKLKNCCYTLQIQDKSCYNFKCQGSIWNFVQTYIQFFDYLKTTRICKKQFNQDYELNKEYNPSGVLPICGTV